MINDNSWLILTGTKETGAKSGECDCACSEDGFNLTLAAATIDSPLQRAVIHQQTLSSSHSLLFNPYHPQGVVVINQAVQTEWECFDSPRSVRSINAATLPLVRQMLQAGLLQPVGAKVSAQRGTPRTLSAWLHITNACNLTCDYCYVHKSEEAMSQEVGLAAVDAILRSAKRGGFRRVKLKFAGGEASLNLKLLFALHSYAETQTKVQGLELETVILSNGVALGERAIRELEQRGIRVMISLDGVGEWHDAQRTFRNGTGSFAWTSRTLDRLIAQGVKPFISITVTDRNVEGLPEVVEYVLKRGLPFNLNFFRDNDCASTMTDLRLQDDRLIEAMNRVFAVIEANLPEHSLLGCLVDRAQFDQPHDKTCGVGDSYLVVDHHGRVAKCHMEIEKSVTDVYAEDPLAFVRLDEIGVQNVSVDEKEGCRECEWKYWCAGGCPVLTYRATGRFDVKSPYCRVYKAIYPQLLRLEGLRLLKVHGITPN